MFLSGGPTILARDESMRDRGQGGDGAGTLFSGQQEQCIVRASNQATVGSFFFCRHQRQNRNSSFQRASKNGIRHVSGKPVEEEDGQRRVSFVYQNLAGGAWISSSERDDGEISAMVSSSIERRDE